MEEKKKSGFATAGLVLGIIGVCTSFIPIVNNVSFILGIIGVLFGVVALIKRASKGQAIASVILCVLAIVITINSQKALSESLNAVSESLNATSEELNKATGNSTEEILENDANVEMGTFEVTKESYGLTSTKLTVNVTNKTSEKKSYSFHIEAVDSNGSRINEDYVYANDLTAGQSQSFDIFTYVSSDKLEAMQNATFKIVEASMY